MIGWTLAAYNVAAAAGSIAAVAASERLTRSTVIVVSLLASVPALYVILAMPPGSVGYFAAVVAAGALGNTALPVLIVAAQDLAPYAVATASGLLGSAVGVAALAYAAVGLAQQTLGVTTAMRMAYLAVLPAAAVTAAMAASNRTLAAPAPAQPSVVCTCAPCLCGTCPRSLLGHR